MSDPYTFVAFDNYVQTATTTAVAYTSDIHASTLGLFDQIALSVTAEQVSGSNPRLTLELEHSADGIRWLVGPVNPLVDNVLLDAAATNVFLGYSDGTVPLLRFVRLKLTLTALVAGISTRVRIDAALNDSRESQFSEKVRALMERAEDLDQCVARYQGGTPITDDAISEALTHIKHAPFSYITNGQLDPSASVCVLPDGSLVVSKQGAGSFQTAPPGKGTGEGASTSGMSSPTPC